MPDARPPEAPVDLAIPPLGKPTPALTATEPAKPETCHAIVLARPIEKSSFGCIIDEQISKQRGILTFPCRGDGEAEAAFGEQLYRGQAHDGELDLEAKTELDWPGDGCRWGTTANIRGRVDGELAWSYRDYVVRGQNCSGTCTARSVFAVRRPTAPAPVMEDVDGH